MKKLLTLISAMVVTMAFAISAVACTKTTPSQTDNQARSQEETILNLGEDNAFVGQQFIDVAEADPNGETHRLSEYVGKGHWVLIDFWASWCPPCRAEMPNVVANYHRYHSKGFDVVGLSLDGKKEAWVAAIRQLEMPWVHLSDLKGWDSAAADTYNIRAIPANFLVDPKGKIVAADLRGEQLGEALKAIFGE